jgi:signal peptidase I
MVRFAAHFSTSHIAFDRVKLAEDGMSPTLEKGELAIYEKRVDPKRLERDAVIVFRVSTRSAWGEPGWLVISRILARPGDRLSIRGQRYLINGREGPRVPSTRPYEPVVHVPSVPDVLTIPDGCYFVIQDRGFDSRVLALVETGDIVSARLYYLRREAMLREVK